MVCKDFDIVYTVHHKVNPILALHTFKVKAIAKKAKLRGYISSVLSSEGMVILFTFSFIEMSEPVSI